ncbi:hypothetical protein AwDysgo_13450 [Bacteroidales bacterium]|nr:hypothetical protein AwDysgo_13450 [Bacteroidales bacterium]
MICISQDIRIKIVSEDDALPLPQASIKILGAGSTLHSSYTADEKGESRMKVPLDSFDIYVSYMGYVDTRLSVKNTESKDIDLGSIAMYVDSTNRLDEIVVTAQSIIEGVNKTIVFPTSQQLKASN